MTTNITDSQNENNATNMSTSILTASDAIDCSDPDPNRRALECIQAADSSWFKQEMLLLENKRGVAVGQLTPVGNLLLRGTVVERSVGEPAADDYQIGSVDGNGDFIATIWIDAASGDLHLRGSLTEVNGNIVYTEGKTALTNQRGIILALADRGTGDLAVRGNVVPYRRTIG